jgi:hypothetical protein
MKQVRGRYRPSVRHYPPHLDIGTLIRSEFRKLHGRLLIIISHLNRTVETVDDTLSQLLVFIISKAASSYQLVG